MKLSDYKKLLGNYIGRDGNVHNGQYSTDESRLFFRNQLMKQLECDFDINNVIILFSNKAGGTQRCFKTDEGKSILINYCTYILEILWILADHGIKWKDGRNIRDYCLQTLGAGMVIVEDGMASIATNANPLKPEVSSHQKKNHSTIHWTETTDRELKLKRILKQKQVEKEIFFSGFFKARFNKPL